MFMSSPGPNRMQEQPDFMFVDNTIPPATFGPEVHVEEEHISMCSYQSAVSVPTSNTEIPVNKELSMDILLKLKNEANSRRNFALKQAEQMFTYDERLTSNCQGKRGKKQIDKKRLEVIRQNTLRLWPLENKEDEGKAWHDCRRAIDEGGRQLNHRAKLHLSKAFA